MMTREQVLVEMEEDFALMSEDERAATLFSEGGRDWSPRALIEEVRGDTEYGKRYVAAWSADRDRQALLEQLLGQLLGPQPECNDPNCEVHGHGNKPSA